MMQMSVQVTAPYRGMFLLRWQIHATTLHLIPAIDLVTQGVVLPLFISHGCKECGHALNRLPAHKARVCLFWDESAHHKLLGRMLFCRHSGLGSCISFVLGCRKRRIDSG